MNRKQLAAVFALFLIAMPLPTGIFPSLVGAASATFPGEVGNSTFEIATPAFLMVNMIWTDGAFRREVLGFNDVLVTVSGDGHPVRVVTSNPTPVEPSTTVRITVYPHDVGPNGYILWDKNYTSGVAGSYFTAYVILNMQVMFNASYFPLEIQFRPYDAATGAGLPIEQFNITAQFGQECVNEPTCNALYLASNETSVGLGHLKTFYGIPITIRARDYFGNLLYNETRTLRMNETNFCTPMQGFFDPGIIPCGLKSDAFYAWDLPMNVYSTKFYNQKPDQFVRINLHWNGTGAGEEVYGGPNNGLFPPWWDSAYSYRNRVRINTSEAVPDGYIYNMTLDGANYVATDKLEPDFRDLRIVYWNGSSWAEVPRTFNGTNLTWEQQEIVNRSEVGGSNAAWNFDEATGTSAADSTGNGNTGTLTSGALWSYGTSGSAVLLDGTNDYVSVADSATVSITSAFTLSAWIKTTSIVKQQGILEKYGYPGFGFAQGYGFRITNTGVLTAFTCDVTSTCVQATGTSIVSANTWHLVEAVYDRSTLKLYMDGREDASASGTKDPFDGTGTLKIGARGDDATNTFSGQIDGARIYAFARSPSQVACDYRPKYCTAVPANTTTRDYWIYYGNPNAQAPTIPTNFSYRMELQSSIPGGAWPYDEGAGNSVADVSGNGNTGSFVGGPAFPTWTDGLLRRAINFDGSNDATSVSTTASIDPSGKGLTIEGWVNRTDAAKYAIVLAERSGGSIQFQFTWFPSTAGGASHKLHLDTDFGTGIVGFDSTSQFFATNTWNHVAVTYDGASVKFYFDGSEVGSISETRSIANLSIATIYTGFDANSAYSDSNFDAISIYPRAFSQTEIWAHYNTSVNHPELAQPAWASLDDSPGFEWYQSPGETVERFLNPGYYSARIATDNTTGARTVVTVGINVTSANYYMISGLNITHFLGDFFQISNQQIQIASALRPDVITIGELLPRNPSELTSPGAELFLLIHPFSIMRGTEAYTAPTAGSNLTLFAPNITSDSGDGSLMTTLNVLKDVYVFGGSATAHVWVNATNGTNLWESSTLPPTVTLAGYSGDVYVVSNQSIQVTRISDFRAIWEFSFRYYPTTKRYEQSLTLNNSGNRTILTPKWFVGFPENRSINQSTAAVKDLDNVVWLKAGQNFEVGSSGFYMDFDALNASTVRAFFFTFYDTNDTVGLSTPVLELHDLVHSNFEGDTEFFKGSVTYSNGLTVPYTGDIAIRFMCSECPNIKPETIQVVDRNTGRSLGPSEYFPIPAGVLIVRDGVGEVPVGSSRTYDVYVKLSITPETTGPGIFGPFVVLAGLPISVFLLLMIATIGSLIGAVMVTGKGKKEENWRSTWLSAFFIFAMITLTLFIMNKQGWLA